ncbi:class II aldolase/adducin family protein [bacterium]|nr:MAG: class II aldolase/adducin family protein [bacterium]
MLVVDIEEKHLGGVGEPSSEIPLHLTAYQIRDDVNAVIHAHPVYASVFACTGMELPYDLLPEVAIKLGKIPTAPFALPTTNQLTEMAKDYLKKHNAFLLKNHGAITLGRDIDEAFLRMELVEHLAKITFMTKVLGGYEKISPENIKALEKLNEGWIE